MTLPNRSWRLPMAAAALSLSLGFVVGCSDDDGDDPEPTVGPTTEAPDETTTSEPEEETTTTEEPEETTSTTEAEDEVDTTSTTAEAEEVEADVEAEESSWQANPSAFRESIGRRIGYECEPGGELYAVWGDGMYTDDSSVCSAAVHAGLIDIREGGRVVVEIAAGLEAYVGSAANGVETYEYGSWGGSFFFPVLGEPDVARGGNLPAD